MSWMIWSGGLHLTHAWSLRTKARCTNEYMFCQGKPVHTTFYYIFQCICTHIVIPFNSEHRGSFLANDRNTEGLLLMAYSYALQFWESMMLKRIDRYSTSLSLSAWEEFVMLRHKLQVKWGEVKWICSSKRSKLRKVRASLKVSWWHQYFTLV